MEQENYLCKKRLKEEFNENLLTVEAEKWAKSISSDKLTKNQIRKFFDEAKLIENKLNHVDDFSKVKPRFKMLKSKVFYAASRKKKEYENFKNYLVNLINFTEDKEDFKAFLQYFESVLGFFTFYAKE